MANAKKTPSATFNATITPATIVKGNTARGVRYSKLEGATVARKGKADLTRTVMAFGRANAAVARVLRAGKPVDVVCQWDGGTVRIVGRQAKAA